MASKRHRQRVRRAALAYLAARDIYDADPDGIGDDLGPHGRAYDKAFDRFETAIGFGFAAEPDEVAQLIVDLVVE